MHRLPDELENELQKKFPNVHIRKLVDLIFRMTLEKALKDGSCYIREFGRFSTYKVKSTKLGKDVIRFKFRISTTLDKKIKTDQYYLDNIPASSNYLFGEKNENICKDKKNQREANVVAEKEAEKIGRDRTKKHVLTDEISNILHELELFKENE